MVRVERHLIKGTSEINALCRLSSQLYNRCTFLMRQSWFKHERLPDIKILVSQTQAFDCFKSLHNTKTAKQTIRKCLTDWSNFKKALVAWKKDKTLFKRIPKPPNYKDKMAQVFFYDETILKKPIKLGILSPTNKCFSIRSKRKFKQVVITPKTFGFIVEVQYDVEPERAKVSKQKSCSIDLGLNNLCAITSDQHKPILVNGRIVKSINQWFNKHPGKNSSRKRYFRMENYFHHVSKMLVDNCVRFGIGQIIVGRNMGWKTRLSLGSITNQNFQSVPFFKLIEKIRYKAEMVGVDVVETEEAYTSKASYLDRDPIPEYDKKRQELKFSGTRTKRGLYKTKSGRLLNADVNGSANIARKVIRDEGYFLRLDRSLAARPVKINPLKESLPEVLGLTRTVWSSKPDQIYW